MRMFLAVVTLAGAMIIPAAAQKADLSGTWKLNVSKSFMGSEHPTSNYELIEVIDQSGGRIKETELTHATATNIPPPGSGYAIDLTPDGQAHKGQRPGRRPVQFEVTTQWQGDTLLATERSLGRGGVSITKTRYYLSDNRNQLVELVDGYSLDGDSEQRLVFDRQPASVSR